MTQTQLLATAKWQAKAYDQIRFMAPKGKRALYADAAKARGLSMRAMILAAIEEYIVNHPTAESVDNDGNEESPQGAQ